MAAGAGLAAAVVDVLAGAGMLAGGDASASSDFSSAVRRKRCGLGRPRSVLVRSGSDVEETGAAGVVAGAGVGAGVVREVGGGGIFGAGPAGVVTRGCGDAEGSEAGAFTGGGL